MQKENQCQRPPKTCHVPVDVAPPEIRTVNQEKKILRNDAEKGSKVLQQHVLVEQRGTALHSSTAKPLVSVPANKEPRSDVEHS